MGPEASNGEARYRVVHRIVYRFAEAVRDVTLDLRLSPDDGPGRVIEHHQLIVDPLPLRLTERLRDANRNLFARAELAGALRTLEIAAVTTVRARAPASDPVAVSSLEAQLAQAGVRAPSPGPASGRCRALTEDTIARLRAIGVEAAYVSGYLLPSVDGRTDAHAWVSVAVPAAGAEAGAWLDFDPSLHELAGARHIRLARGHGYDDVAPVLGALSGRGPFQLESVVHVERLRAG
ncbi:MAG: transglutaminase N-terminal domain-containing protein [Polyangiaceae bacterium]